jgi:hypothetical protein
LAQNLPSTSRYIAAIMFSLAHSVVRWYAVQRSGDSSSARTQFLAAVSDVADNISAAADAQILHLWFDAGVTNVSDIGLCLFKVRRRVYCLADDKAEGCHSAVRRRAGRPSDHLVLIASAAVRLSASQPRHGAILHCGIQILRTTRRSGRKFTGAEKTWRFAHRGIALATRSFRSIYAKYHSFR